MRRGLLLTVVLAVTAFFAACAATRAPTTVTTPDFRLHFSDASTTPRPLVLVLGATGRSLADIVQDQGQDDYADQQGYAVAYLQPPRGTHDTWATGPDSSPGGMRDDLPYLLAQLDLIRTQVAVDPHRIYLEGWSNGGFFALRAALARPDLFAAVGEAEAVLDVPLPATGSRSPREPIRVVHVHATRDQIVPIAGGTSPLLEASVGRPVALPSSYAEGRALPRGSIWRLVTVPGSGPGFHDYQPGTTAVFWQFLRAYRR